jgi:cytochrome P450
MMSTADATEYDPFEEFNRAAGIGVVEDPYPLFTLARQTAPLIQEDVRAMAGLEVDGEDQGGFIDPGLFGELPDVYTAFTFDAAQAVLRDGETFSSKGYEDVMGQVMGHTILEMDEPEHHTYRGIVQQAFSRKTMERWEVEAITPIIDEHIDAFIDRGRAELVRELTFPFPVRVIARLLGLPNSEMEQFHRLAVELISVGFDMDRGLAASRALGDYFGTILAERRRAPADDLMSTLAQAELDGQHLTDDEIFAFLRLLLPAGAETTYRSSGNLLFGLLNHPDQLDALRNDRSLMGQAIEEGLRWEPPLLTIIRTATRDTEVEGVPIRAGSMIVINMGSANHDEKYWTDPETFDIFRPQRQHLAFAFGPHMCLGMHLARMETRIVLERLMDRLPGLRLDRDVPAPFITGMTFRNPDRLPVVWG